MNTGFSIDQHGELSERDATMTRIECVDDESIKDGDRKFIENLENDIQKSLQILKGGVNILLEGDYGHNQTPENVLWGHVCGRVVRVLGYLLRGKGYAAIGYETHDLGEGYPTHDHAILVVASPNGKKVIVDGAYLQFINVFWLIRKDLPKEEILVVSEDNIDRVVESFARLKELKISQHPDPTVLAQRSIFRMTHEELAKYFANIWDTTKYSEITRTLEDDIRKYESDPNEVTLPTRKLIEYLQFTVSEN